MPPSDPSRGAPVSAPLSDPVRRAAVLVCFSHLRWGFVYQRPQHLLTRAAKHFRVFFVEEPIYAKAERPRLDRTGADGGVEVVVPVLPEGTGPKEAEAIQRDLIGALLTQVCTGPVVFWYYTPMALGFTDQYRPDVCVYDCMDELSAFKFAPPELTERERELFDRAALVFTGGRSLFEAKQDRHRSVHLFPSSIDKAHFGQARDRSGAEPDDQAGVPHPRLGFFGVIDERLDLALMAQMAELRPDWHFVMIGPVVKIDPNSLPRRPNIHWLGPKGYPELPRYLAGWDVGLMPFAMNESTRFISPTKTPEFLAAGVPVVSTPIVDVVRSYGEAGVVEIATSAAEMVAKAEKLLAQNRGPWLAAVDHLLADMSWDNTWKAMNALIDGELAAGVATSHSNAVPVQGAAYV